MLKAKLENKELMSCCYVIEKAFYHYTDELVSRNKKLKACKFKVFASIMINVSGESNWTLLMLLFKQKHSFSSSIVE